MKLSEKDFFEPHRVNIDTTSKDIVSKVIEIYGRKNAWDLVGLTHKEESPWFLAKKEEYPTIPDELIKEYYSERLK